MTDSKNKTKIKPRCRKKLNTFHLKLAAISTIIIITEAKDRNINTNSQQNVNLRKKNTVNKLRKLNTTTIPYEQRIIQLPAVFK